MSLRVVLFGEDPVISSDIWIDDSSLDYFVDPLIYLFNIVFDTGI